jgi:hypothetical protein
MKWLIVVKGVVVVALSLGALLGVATVAHREGGGVTVCVELGGQGGPAGVTLSGSSSSSQPDQLVVQPGTGQVSPVPRDLRSRALPDGRGSNGPN